MTWVKVCGLSRAEDVEAAANSGADAVGFVFYSKSPRLVTVEQARDLGSGFPGWRVAVTVDLEPGQLLRLAAKSEADTVQPYGSHALSAATAAMKEGFNVLLPVVVDSRQDFTDLPDYALPLLDSAEFGGSGDTFDWDLAAGIDRDFVLAGGLSPDNVAQAIGRVEPWGVDASSGLESAPGIKDPAKVAAFVERAKAQ